MMTFGILTYWYARCICKLWNALWFYCVFWVLICQMYLQVMEGSLILLRFWVFSYIIDEYSCLKYCIFTKLSQIVCLINVHILVCQHVKCDCWLWKVFYLICVFWEFFIYFTTCLKRYNFIKLLQVSRQTCRSEK